MLTEIDLSQNDDSIVIREESFLFLEKDVSSQILYMSHYYFKKKIVSAGSLSL